MAHGNIKSSNIFLKHYGCVSDFGFKNASQEDDVYSFGIVLLELLTGKSPMDIAAWVRSDKRISNLFGQGFRGMIVDEKDRLEMVLETEIQGGNSATLLKGLRPFRVLETEIQGGNSATSLKGLRPFLQSVVVEIKMLQVALRCLFMFPNDRPKMHAVELMLEKIEEYQSADVVPKYGEWNENDRLKITLTYLTECGRRGIQGREGQMILERIHLCGRERHNRTTRKKYKERRMMIITQNLLLLILLQLFLQTCDAKHDNCSSSSECGVIRNISFPFRLKDDPKHCGYPQYELACENNITTISLKSQKFHVKAINYHNNTIRLAYVSINNYSFSFPSYSLYAYNFSDQDPYHTKDPYYYYYYYGKGPPYEVVAWPINFMSCPYSLKNSSLLTEISERDGFFNASNLFNSKRHTYIKVGHMNASDVSEDMCGIDKIVLTSWKFKDSNNVSLSEIHESLLYGYELSWFSYPCVVKCKPRSYCNINQDHTATCSQGASAIALLIFVLVIVVVFAGISIPAKIIFGLTSLCGFMYLNGWEWYFGLNEFAVELLSLLIYIAILCGVRFVILFPCVMGILIYKFRRRHLSTFDAIERFLQSDNQLMPIRYSYSDIKRMTRGFQEKLGQGGYGSVYKGKQRSGHDVAVKLLKKPGGNGQDFMNEIATIGRIHHVNVVKLVGFCAEGSKRALIFDFMPNGSLEKYIFSRENMNSLSWEKKYEIAVGVARGIEYLHRGCDIQILHFDIKPHNILLDDKFIPKISDFGLAKVCSTNKNTVTLTAARGTIGYVAPELINRGIGGVSYKADVYSFGMMLMEMVGLNRDSRGSVASSSQYFPCWIYDCFDQGKDIEIGKTNDDDDDNDGARMIVRKMTIMALWCIQMSPDARPSMNKVLEMLEGEVERLKIPHRPSQSAQVVVNVDQSWTTTYSTDSASLLYHHDTPPNVEITVEMT